VKNRLSTPVSEDAKKNLRQVGLTEYETRTYLTLLGRGVLTASETSEYSGVPYSKVYETLNSLERKGWLEAESGRPRRYFPKAPSEALEAARLRMEDMVNEWKRIVLGELQPLYERRELLEKPDIWILRGEFSILAKLREMLGVTRKELMIAAPSFAKDFVDAFTAVLSQLQNSGVSVQVMMAGDWDVKKIAEVGEARVRDNLFGGGVIADSKEALLFLGEAETSGSYSGLLVIWSNHVGLVKFAREYFQLLWDTAKPT
jgi:sugar-specific transcriptional regulator TrmB